MCWLHQVCTGCPIIGSAVQDMQPLQPFSASAISTVSFFKVHSWTVYELHFFVDDTCSLKCGNHCLSCSAPRHAGCNRHCWTSFCPVRGAGNMAENCRWRPGNSRGSQVISCPSSAKVVANITPRGTELDGIISVAHFLASDMHTYKHTVAQT